MNPTNDDNCNDYEAISPNQLKSNDIIVAYGGGSTITVSGVSVGTLYVAVTTREFGVIQMSHEKILRIKKRPKPPIPLMTVLEGAGTGNIYVKTCEGWLRVREDGKTEITGWDDDRDIRKETRQFNVIRSKNGASTQFDL